MDEKEGFSIDNDYSTTSRQPLEYSQSGGTQAPRSALSQLADRQKTKPSTLHTRVGDNGPKDPEPPTPKDKGGKGGANKVLLIIVIILAVLVIAGAGGFIWYNQRQQEQLEQVKRESEAAEIAYQEQMAQQDLLGLEQEFQSIENPREMIITDSVKMRLTEKYESARLEVEKLQRELKDTKNKSAKEIADLRAQIATLRALLKHYLEEIDRLNKENEALRTENAEVKQNNERLNAQVQETSRQNAHLTERMTLAEKLNVSGVSLQALNGKGKKEKKVTKAKQLVITFTIPQNNSTPVGEKTIYARITTPEGQLLEGGGSFSFEGGTLAASAKKTIEYGGQEIAGIKIYYDVRTAINAGSYTVELFSDNYRLTSQHFTLK